MFYINIAPLFRCIKNILTQKKFLKEKTYPRNEGFFPFTNKYHLIFSLILKEKRRKKNIMEH
jgi:hypothetical protein